MPDVNFEWVRQQMQDAKVKVAPGVALLRLLESWDDLENLTSEQAKEVVYLFNKLALGINIHEEIKSDEVWIPVQPGDIKVGDEVRVLKDAFTDSTGVLHNGRRGKVIAVRYGDIIFKSTDGKEPALNGVHYSPYKLEKRIR